MWAERDRGKAEGGMVWWEAGMVMVWAEGWSVVWWLKGELLNDGLVNENDIF